ncbi:MAG: hypothetical protein JSR46_00520 [Verrucomicrobia bacterium]|nr:hypothetical protein [Verrucomicrobiota bacterium]
MSITSNPPPEHKEHFHPPAEAPKKDQSSGVISSLFGYVAHTASWCAHTIHNCFHHKEVDDLGADELPDTAKKITQLQELPESASTFPELNKLADTLEKEESSTEESSAEEGPTVIVRPSLKELEEIPIPSIESEHDVFSVTGKIRSLEKNPPIFDTLDKLPQLTLEFKSALETDSIDWIKEIIQNIDHSKIDIDLVWKEIVRELKNEDEGSDQYKLAQDIMDRFEGAQKTEGGKSDYELFNACLNDIAVEELEKQMVTEFKAAVEVSNIPWLKQISSDAALSQLPIGKIWKNVVAELKAENKGSDHYAFAQSIQNRFEELSSTKIGFDPYKLFESCLATYENKPVSEGDTLDELRRRHGMPPQT